MTDTVYSVSQLNRATKRLLVNHFMTVLVSGELSNLSAPASGHLYFTLKDAQAQVRCAMFKGQQSGLRFKPANGQQVLVTAQVTLYEPRGDYQLVVDVMEETGDGALRQAFERLKLKLQQEGLFDNTRKKPLPLLPQTIGVITSASGAAVHDILTVLKRRFPAIPVIIYPVSVQGETAKTEIVQALATANRLQQVDVIILGRGGGSLEDLQAFNEECVARAIAASEIPVISAVGHEVDVTIADFIADFRAATPSAAAETAVPLQSEWLNELIAYEFQLKQQLQRKITHQRQRLEWLQRSLHQQHPGEKLQRNMQRLDEWTQRLHLQMQHNLQYKGQQFAIAKQQLLRQQPAERVKYYQRQLDFLRHGLLQAVQLKLNKLKQQQSATAQLLHAVSPLATLERGYSIAERADNRQVIKSVQQLSVNDLLLNRFAQGKVISQVQEIIHE